jgi:hypothetical protein
MRHVERDPVHDETPSVESIPGVRRAFPAFGDDVNGLARGGQGRSDLRQVRPDATRGVRRRRVFPASEQVRQSRWRVQPRCPWRLEIERQEIGTNSMPNELERRDTATEVAESMDALDFRCSKSGRKQICAEAYARGWTHSRACPRRSVRARAGVAVRPRCVRSANATRYDSGVISTIRPSLHPYFASESAATA